MTAKGKKLFCKWGDSLSCLQALCVCARKPHLMLVVCFQKKGFCEPIFLLQDEEEEDDPENAGDEDSGNATPPRAPKKPKANVYEGVRYNEEKVANKQETQNVILSHIFFVLQVETSRYESPTPARRRLFDDD